MWGLILKGKKNSTKCVYVTFGHNCSWTYSQVREIEIVLDLSGAFWRHAWFIRGILKACLIDQGHFEGMLDLSVAFWRHAWFIRSILKAVACVYKDLLHILHYGAYANVPVGAQLLPGWRSWSQPDHGVLLMFLRKLIVIFGTTCSLIVVATCIAYDLSLFSQLLQFSRTVQSANFTEFTIPPQSKRPLGRRWRSTGGVWQTMVDFWSRSTSSTINPLFSEIPEQIFF